MTIWCNTAVSMNLKVNSATAHEMDLRMKMGVMEQIWIFRSIGKDRLGMEECIVLKGAYPNSGQSNQMAKGPHPRFSSWEPNKSIIREGCIVEFTLTPAVVLQDFKTEEEGKDNQNSHLLCLIYIWIGQKYSQ
jgi:hypothetical protein